ncbi:MAG: phosphoribosylglycinamide formyltransferase [Myxococcota bacterium]
MRVGVLVSGSGSNLQALLDADLGPARVVVVLSNVPGVKALDRAASAGVPTVVLPHQDHASREHFDRAMVGALRDANVELVVLAGFMRLVTPVFLNAFPDRVINIHPALLPAFPGVQAQKQAFEAKVRITGCTVHLVDAGMDTGPILAQAAVPVLDDDRLIDLQRRILATEHALLPRVVRAIATGRLRPASHRLRLAEMRANETISPPRLVSPNDLDQTTDPAASSDLEKTD